MAALTGLKAAAQHWRGRVVWLSAHAWKACFLKGNAGSNPALSAFFQPTCGGYDHCDPISRGCDLGFLRFKNSCARGNQQKAPGEFRQGAEGK